MVTVEEATSIILENCFTPVPESVPVTEAQGRVLSEPVKADRDFPPFNRVAMDGIAIAYDRWKEGNNAFMIEDTQAAGNPQKVLKDDSKCIEVMTGAVLPEGTDTVIRYEDLKIESSLARILTDKINKRQNVHPQGQDARQNELLIEPGTVLSSAEIALLATVGLANVDVLSLPAAAVVSSGDELVDIKERPEPHQIRRSNTYAIQAAMRALGWPGTQFHLPDHEDFLRDSLASILAAHDVIILSGGVSKGKFDFVPAVLRDIGVKQLFHQVSQRPGKPFWFGATPKGKVVFALPGNPVSTFMCFHRYVKPWFQASFGLPPYIEKAILSKDVNFEPSLTYFLQVLTQNLEGRLIAEPIMGGGSGDFANLKAVNGFMELPLEKTTFRAGEVYPFIPFR